MIFVYVLLGLESGLDLTLGGKDPFTLALGAMGLLALTSAAVINHLTSK